MYPDWQVGGGGEGGQWVHRQVLQDQGTPALHQLSLNPFSAMMSLENNQ